MRAVKALPPIVLGLLIPFVFMKSLAHVSVAVAESSLLNSGTIVYLDKDASGSTHDGTSWTDAYTTVQDALTAAISGTQIWVAEGVYYPDEGAGQINDLISSTFALTNNVALYGGFDPGSGVDLFEERDWTAYPTVLSGDIDHETNPDITDPDGVVTDTANISGNNAYHVVYSDGVTENMILDGFTITAGQADGLWPDNNGGGMYNNNNSDPTLTNVTFSGNSAESYGGGMYNANYSSPTLTNVNFYSNSADAFGGGMYDADNSNPTLTNVDFSGNQAVFYGGGLVNMSSHPALTNVIFSGNSSANGGGMYNVNSYATLTNVTFSGNSVSDNGGGMYNNNSDTTLTNTILWGNTASTSGDQIYNTSSTPVISYSDIQGSGGSDSWDTSLGTDGGNNIDADPLFVRDPDPGDGDWTTLNDNDYGDLHLRLHSPAIDAGTDTGCPATDIEGNPRSQGDRCDMGAYETNPVGLLFVDADAAGEATGLSWTDAFTNVQDALSSVYSDTQIWVAEGIYYPDEGAGQINDVITSTFVLTDGVFLYGGFDPGSGVVTFTQRNWETYLTILSGDIDHETNPDTTDPNGVVTATSNITGNNAYNVVTGINVTQTTILDGFSITAGKTDNNGDYQYGGGMYIHSSHPELANLSLSGNQGHFGGGMYLEVSNPTLMDLTFSGNSAYYGGAIFITVGSTPKLTNVTFSGNAVDANGGGICNYGNPILTNVVFSGNSAIYGGGMYDHNTSGTDPILRNVIFSGNLANTFGGGMYNYNSDPTLINVTFSGNSADNCGGGIYNYNSYPTLTNTVLWGNGAGTSYDQICNHSGSTPVISYSDIQSSGGSVSWVTSMGTDGGDNIDADPLFVRNPDPGDGDWTTLADNDYGDLHLQPGSPAIDAGTNTGCPETDMDGNPRPVGLFCDMGAYELNTFNLEVAKSVDDATLVSGQTITFTIIVTSTGPGHADVLISDTLPSGLNFVGPVTLQPAEAGSVGSSPPTIAHSLVISANHSVTVTFPVSVSYGLAAGLTLTNTTWVTSTQMLTPVQSSITMIAVNLPPEALDDDGAGFTTDEDTPFTTASVLLNDTDPEDDPLSVDGFDASDTKGLVTDNGNGNGTFDYDPNGQFNYLGVGESATDTFSYTVSDGNGRTDIATVTITINGVNDPPLGTDDSGTGFTTDEDTSFTTANVLLDDSDPEGDSLSIQSIDTSGTKGLVTDNGNGTFTYDPNGQYEALAEGESTTDTFTYTVDDGNGGTDVATVIITINGKDEQQDQFFIYLPLVSR